jgi:hypothetical protein
MRGNNLFQVAQQLHILPRQAKNAKTNKASELEQKL